MTTNTSADFKVYRVEGMDDLYVLEMKEQVVHDVTGMQLTDVSHKMYVNKDDVEHLISVMSNEILK